MTNSFVAKWLRPPGNTWARRIYLPQRRMVEIGSDNAPGPILAVVAVVNMGGVGDRSGAAMRVLAAFEDWPGTTLLSSLIRPTAGR